MQEKLLFVAFMVGQIQIKTLLSAMQSLETSIYSVATQTVLYKIKSNNEQVAVLLIRPELIQLPRTRTSNRKDVGKSPGRLIPVNQSILETICNITAAQSGWVFGGGPYLELNFIGRPVVQTNYITLYVLVDVVRLWLLQSRIGKYFSRTIFFATKQDLRLKTQKDIYIMQMYINVT